MKTVKQTAREAKQLFRLCLVDGSVDESRARKVVHDVVAGGRAGRLGILSRFEHLVKLDRLEHTANVESATPLAMDVRGSIEADLGRIYGKAIAISFADNPALIGGVRITVGSDVYDGSVKARLAALEARL
jgi:F-type H+-transporting ATPase subunit delta